MHWLSDILSMTWVSCFGNTICIMHTTMYMCRNMYCFFHVCNYFLMQKNKTIKFKLIFCNHKYFYHSLFSHCFAGIFFFRVILNLGPVPYTAVLFSFGLSRCKMIGLLNKAWETGWLCNDTGELWPKLILLTWLILLTYTNT